MLIIGATGMLGRALVTEAHARQINVVGAARSGADVTLDIRDDALLAETLLEIAPDVVVNSAAIADVNACERDPAQAYLVNARAVAVLAGLCDRLGARLVQISTDHYYTGDGDRRHAETDSVTFMNEYARSKFCGEAFAATSADHLIVRTNVTGLRGREKPTFFEWVIRNLEASQSFSMFDDIFVSTLHTRQFADALMDLLDTKWSGLLNIASRDVFTKKQFIQAVADRMEVSFASATTASVSSLEVPRPESLGLDVSRAESLLGHRLPSLNDTVQSLVDAYYEES